MDSPKHMECLKQGKKSQTYKVAGKPYFKCAGCGSRVDKDMVELEDYMWKTEPKKWEELMRSRGIEQTMINLGLGKEAKK